MATYNSTEVPGTLPDPVRSHHFSIPCYMIRKWLVMLDAKARKAVHLKENPSAGLWPKQKQARAVLNRSGKSTVAMREARGRAAQATSRWPQRATLGLFCLFFATQCASNTMTGGDVLILPYWCLIKPTESASESNKSFTLPSTALCCIHMVEWQHWFGPMWFCTRMLMQCAEGGNISGAIDSISACCYTWLG